MPDRRGSVHEPKELQCLSNLRMEESLSSPPSERQEFDTLLTILAMAMAVTCFQHGARPWGTEPKVKCKQNMPTATKSDTLRRHTTGLVGETSSSELSFLPGPKIQPR